MENQKLGSFEAIGLLLIIMLAHIILNIPQALMISTGSAALLNSLYISILAFIFCFFITKLINYFKNKDIFNVAEFLGGKSLKYILGVVYILYLLFLTSSLTRDFCGSLKTIYFPEISVTFIVFILILSAVLVNRLGFKTVTKCNLIILPVILITMLIIFFSTANEFVFERALPILGKGIKETFFTGATNIYGFSGLAVLYILLPMLKRKKDFKTVSYTSTLICSIYLFLSVASLLLIFPFLTKSESVLSIYLSTRKIEFGKFLQSSDALFLLIWLCTIFSYLSIVLGFTVYVFRLITTSKKSNSILYSLAITTLLCAIIPRSIAQERFLINTVYKYVTLILVFGISPLILLLGLLKEKKLLKKSATKTLSLLIIISLTFVPLTGCTLKSVEELGYVIALGLDIGENDILKISFQIATPKGSSSSGSSGSSSSGETSNSIIETIECSSITDGLNILNTYLSKQINLSHCNIIIFSEELAQNGISNYIYDLINNIEIRPYTKIVVSKTSTEEFFKNSATSLESFSTKYDEIASTSEEYTGYTDNVTISDFFSRMSDTFGEAYSIYGGIETKTIKELDAKSSSGETSESSSRRL